MSTLTVHAPEAALRYCQTVTRQRARNFYYGLKLLPEPKRSALYAIYAWMRRADDIVDAQGIDDGTRLERLRTFRVLTDQAIEGQIGETDPLWEAIAYAAERFPLSGGHFHALLDGQLDDLRQRAYQTFDQLREYCHRVASTVGLLCIEVWGYDDDRAPGLAGERGVAFQLTNIIRDFAQDYDSGRIYLPADEFEVAGLTPRSSREWAQPEAGSRFLMGQIRRARSFYESSAELEGLIAEDCRPTLWAMTSIYRGLLEKAAEQPAHVVSGRRLRLSSLAKATIALRARLMARGDDGDAAQ